MDTQYTYPSNIINGLTGTELRIINEVAYLSRLSRARSHIGAEYSVCGQKYLARKCGRSISAIQRACRRLWQIGVLTRKRRRMVAGRWQTNLLTVRRSIKRAAASLLGLLRQRSTPHSVNAVIAISIDDNLTSAPGAEQAKTQNVPAARACIEEMRATLLAAGAWTPNRLHE